MLSEEEIQSVKNLYPELSFVNEVNKYFLRGKLTFKAFYDRNQNALIINPDNKSISTENIISDIYEIEIELPWSYPSSLPLVREIGGRIPKIAKKYAIKDIIDLHVNKYSNNNICLCTKPEESLKYPNGMNIIDFLNSLVVPFFYSLSYYEKKREWPWGVYSHRDLGIFEFYAEHRNSDLIDASLINNCKKALSNKQCEKLLGQKNTILEDLDCLCGSLKKFRNCHKKAFKGAMSLKKDIQLLQPW